MIESGSESESPRLPFNQSSKAKGNSTKKAFLGLAGNPMLYELETPKFSQNRETGKIEKLVKDTTNMVRRELFK
jgi:hypothetical protein